MNRGLVKFELRVGSKGELFLTKKIRQIMNIEPGDRVLVEIVEGDMVIRKIDDLVDLFMTKPVSQAQKADRIEDDINSIQDEQISYTLRE